jgi:hypothetical protein
MLFALLVVVVAVAAQSPPKFPPFFTSQLLVQTNLQLPIGIENTAYAASVLNGAVALQSTLLNSLSVTDPTSVSSWTVDLNPFSAQNCIALCKSGVSPISGTPCNVQTIFGLFSSVLPRLQVVIGGTCTGLAGAQGALWAFNDPTSSSQYRVCSDMATAFPVQMQAFGRAGFLIVDNSNVDFTTQPNPALFKLPANC